MALLDLSLVTRCFTTMLSERLPAFPVWPGSATLNVSAGPPDAVNGAHALSFYLYHVREAAHAVAQDWPASGDNPQRLRPMSLTLSYVLTPRSNIADANLRALADQLMMGLALKTLRDCAKIDDTTIVIGKGGPVLVMPTAMRGRRNLLRVSLRPTEATEAAQYWQAGTGPVRLAAYYEVAATLLEPDETMTRSGRVLMVGVHTFVRGEPRIDAVTNTLAFLAPGESEPRQLELSPASVPYGGRLIVSGADLKGDRTALLLTHQDFADPVVADAAWKLATDGSVLSVEVQPKASGTTLLPGIYGAMVRTTARKTLPDGSQRDFDAVSNQIGFAIAPAILSVTGGAVRTIKVDRFQPHLLADGDLMVFAGSDRLTRSPTSPPGPGQFHTPSSPAAATSTLRFRFPASAVPGSVLPIRLIVRSAESGPWWETVP
ncbi:hypothetical protein NSE01_05610 [Novosphingobium sediminis]|uniref:Pvc16 N-terminal domain-containing protein n=1 Tax=Novosphingobium sediminis TaxID=707214 RepID=A0A512AG90_9SPHN|nr:Pvc16 family protein [Novosphingobium sediminis]GEN98728.1 hypothetical protein NSE01_05610 [Novosphingobium sediminis]